MEHALGNNGVISKGIFDNNLKCDYQVKKLNEEALLWPSGWKLYLEPYVLWLYCF